MGTTADPVPLKRATPEEMRAEIDKARNVPSEPLKIEIPETYSFHQRKTLKELPANELAIELRMHEVKKIIWSKAAHLKDRTSDYTRVNMRYVANNVETPYELVDCLNPEGAEKAVKMLAKDPVFNGLQSSRLEIAEKIKAANSAELQKQYDDLDKAVGKYISNHCREYNLDLNSELFVTKALAATVIRKPEAKEPEKQLTQNETAEIKLPENIFPVSLKPQDPLTAPISPLEISNRAAPNSASAISQPSP